MAPLKVQIGGRRISFTAALLAGMAAVYILVLGTQVKMMSILGDHHHPSTAANTGALGDVGGRGGASAGHSRQREDISPHHVVVASDEGRNLHGSPFWNRQHHLRILARRQQQGLTPLEGGADGSTQQNPLLQSQSQNNNPVPNSNPKSATIHKGHSKHYKTLATSIASKWNLTTPNAIELLERQFHKVNDYNPTTDFFHFHHLYKSGGTSISNLMDHTIGLNHGILPGSYPSGNFNHEEALADIEQRINSGTKPEELPYRASYAHTGLRPVYGPKRTRTGAFLLEHLPAKKLRAVTMLRDPTDFRASNHAMIMCGLNYEVGRFNGQRAQRGLPQACSPAEGLNISAMVDNKISDLLQKCQKADEEQRRGQTPKLPQPLRQQCRDEARGVDTRKHCRSARHLLDSEEYDKHYRSMFKALMGRFHRGQSFTNSTAYGRMGYGFERAEDSKGYSVEVVEEYTLVDLGGLDPITGVTGTPPEPDFIWFGITERMVESTSLFYYYFKAPPMRKTPIHRVQDCRPTAWWTPEDREEVRRREPADYAVWRAANAILDVRMEKMKMELRNLLQGGETKKSLYYVDWDQLEDIGVTFDSVGDGGDGVGDDDVQDKDDDEEDIEEKDEEEEDIEDQAIIISR